MISPRTWKIIIYSILSIIIVVAVIFIAMDIFRDSTDTTDTTDTTIEKVDRLKVEELVVAEGEIIRIGNKDTKDGTYLLIELEDANGDRHYLSISYRWASYFQTGQEIRAEYTIVKYYDVYSDGSEELHSIWYKYGSEVTKEPQYNEDGSISFIRAEWAYVSLENVIIFP